MAWTMTRDDLISRALEMAGLKSLSVSPQVAQVALAADELNGILEELNSTVVTPIQLQWIAKTLTASSVVASNGTFYTCFHSHTSAAITEPGIGAASEQYWIERGSAGSAWTVSTAYSANGDFTLATDTRDILFMNIQSGETTYDALKSNGYFTREICRSVIGLPTSYYICLTATPRVFLDYQPDDLNYIIHYLRVKSLLSLDAGASETELDKGWYNYLRFALAAAVGNYNMTLPVQRRQDLERQAASALVKARNRDFYRK